MARKRKPALSRRDFFRKGAAAGVGAATLAGLGSKTAAQASPTGEIEWHYEADVVVVGAGATGLPAAIRARDLHASVLVVEQNFDVGGRMLMSAGRVSLGGGDAIQKRDKAGDPDPDGFVQVAPLEVPEALEDDPDLLFRDMTDWSVLDGAAVPRYRFNPPEVMRAWADNTVATRQFLMDNYVRFSRIRGTHPGGGVSRARRPNAIFKLANTTDMRAGTITQDDAGRPDEHSSRFAPAIMVDFTSDAGPGTVRNGTAVARPLEFSARGKGVRFMLNRHMDEIIREKQFSGRVLGIRASYSPRHDPANGVRLESFWQNGNIDERRETINIRARKAVVIGSGGHAGNPQFRSMFYPALAEPNIAPVGWALLGRGGDASGIIAGMRVGATLAGMQQNYQQYWGARIETRLATRDAFAGLMPGHPTFAFHRSTGIPIGLGGFEHLIAVNQVGRRFYSEINLPKQTSHAVFPGGPGMGTKPWNQHIQGDWRNCRVEWIKEMYNRHSGLDAALALNEGSQPPDYLPGPLWAIFDRAALERTGWKIDYPYTADDGFFFKADTIEELAERVMGNPFSRVPMAYLKETVERWNSFVDAGFDKDFERVPPMHRINTPPFYAASIRVSWLDSYGGLRINGRAQVVDTRGEVIPGLYAGGEASGGGEQHGLGRAIVHGYIAGTNVVEEPALAASPGAVRIG